MGTVSIKLCPEAITETFMRYVQRAARMAAWPSAIIILADNPRFAREKG